jgi:uncharacterized protein GlcG (DUF336 family)
MKAHALMAATIVAVASSAYPALAQDVLTEKQISLGLAQEIASAAIGECRKNGYHVAVTVVDRGGRIKAILRDDGGNPHLVEASRRKALTAAAFRSSSGAFAERVRNPDSAPLTTIRGVIALRGGLPIKVGNEVIGAVGVGGAPGGDKDEACAQAGIQKVADKLQ